MIRDHVDRICRYRDRSTEIRLLPTRCRLAVKSRAGEKGSTAGPQACHMCSGIARPLIKTDASDVTGDVRCELHTEFDGRAVGVGSNRRRRGGAPESHVPGTAARCGRRKAKIPRYCKGSITALTQNLKMIKRVGCQTRQAHGVACDLRAVQWRGRAVGRR